MVLPILPHYWRCVTFPTYWHGTANITTLLALCGISHISGMTHPVLPHYWHRVTIPTLVIWYGHYYHITGTVWHFPHTVA